MPSDVDAVIAALRIVLRDAETHTSQLWWKTEVVNRWIGQLPGAWWGRWRRLRLQGDIGNQVVRTALIGHVSATLAYLETHREKIGVERWSWWPLEKRSINQRSSAWSDVKAIPAGSEKSQDPTSSAPSDAKPRWLN